MIFDNSKVKRLVPGWEAKIPFSRGAEEIMTADIGFDGCVASCFARPDGAAGIPDALPLSPAAQLESSLMERLRSARAAGQNPLAIQLAREGNRRFPDSALGPERHSILIHSFGG